MTNSGLAVYPIWKTRFGNCGICWGFHCSCLAPNKFLVQLSLARLSLSWDSLSPLWPNGMPDLFCSLPASFRNWLVLQHSAICRTFSYSQGRRGHSLLAVAAWISSQHLCHQDACQDDRRVPGFCILWQSAPPECNTDKLRTLIMQTINSQPTYRWEGRAANDVIKVKKVTSGLSEVHGAIDWWGKKCAMRAATGGISCSCVGDCRVMSDPVKEWEGKPLANLLVF